MEQAINNFVINLNSIGRGFCDYAGNMFMQSSVLIILLLIIDFLLRKRVRAVLRYCIWMLVFVKLILPPTLSLPTGICYWSSEFLPSEQKISTPLSNIIAPESVKPIMPEEVEISTKPPQLQPSRFFSETTVPAVSTASSLPPITWQAMVFLIWLVGMLLFSFLLIQRLFFVRSLLLQSKTAKGRLLDTLNQCLQQVGIRRSIELKLSNTLQSPAVCGLFKPVILIPTSLLEKLSRDKLRAVLIHELAHIKRGDLWVNLIQTFLQIIYFYNPFVWLANIMVRMIREQAVDEAVLVALGEEAENYTNTLIDIAEMVFWKANFSLRLIGVAESKKALHRRIKHILTRPVPKSAKLGILSLLVVAILAALLLPMAAAATKDNKKDETRFTATLPNGVTVELVGVCEYDGQSKDWWQPDGIPFNPGLKIREHEEFKGQNRLGFAVKLNSDDFKLRYEIEGVSSYSGMDLYDDNGQKLNKYWAALAKLDDDRDVTTFRLGVATGQWQTIAGISDYYGDRKNKGDTDIVFSAPIESKRGTAIAVRGDWDFDGARRIIAIDKDGNIHDGGWHGRSTGLKTLATTEFYDIEPAQIKKYQLQFRPYQWITFKNVSLRPGEKTDVRVDVEQRGGKELEKTVEQAVMTISTCAEKDPRVKESLESLQGLDEQAVVKEMVKFLDSDKNTVRRSAIYILWKGNIESIEPAAAHIQKLCSHKEDFTRGMAALALGAKKVEPSFDILCNMTLTDSSGYARRCAAYALGLMGNPEAKDVLEKALKDSDFNVRNNAEAALTMLSQVEKPKSAEHR